MRSDHLSKHIKTHGKPRGDTTENSQPVEGKIDATVRQFLYDKLSAVEKLACIRKFCRYSISYCFVLAVLKFVSNSFDYL